MTPPIARCLAMILAIPIMAGMFSFASAWVFYHDDRERSHSTMVGTLMIELPEGRGQGTAILVDECGILTNFHAVFGPWYVTALRAPSRAHPGTFTLTEALGPDGRPRSARAIPVIWGDYLGPERQLRRPHEDWAYLVLDQCLGREYGHFWLRDLGLDEPAGVVDGMVAFGYSSGRQMIDPTCSVHAVRGAGDQPSWHHDCALRAGDSGGPIAKRGSQTVVALGAGAVADPADPGCASGGVLARWTARCANLAVPLTQEIIDQVKAAFIATGVQRALLALGYDAGPLGAIDEPRASAAIREVQQEMGWPATGAPTPGLLKILLLRLKLLVS